MKYIRLYLYFVRFSVSTALLFRFDFFFRIIMDCAYYIVNIGFYLVLFDHTTLLAGWTKSEALVFVAGYLWIDALNMTVFANNFWYLPQYINKGELDYYLIRPVSSLFFLSFRELAVNSAVNFLITCGILFYFYTENFGLSVYSMAGLLWYMVLLLFGLWLMICLRLITIIPVFWMHASRGLDTVFWSLQKLAERPDGIFTGTVRLILITALPFAVMFSFPAKLVIEGFELSVFLHLAGLCLLFSFLVAILWKSGLCAYSSASS